jgi:anti-anti-sigma factor
MNDEPPRIPLEISSETVDGTFVVLLTGELDIASRGDLVALVTAVLVDQQPLSVIVRLDELTFMDSTGLNEIINVRRLPETHRVAIEVRGAPPQIRRVFDLTGMSHLLDD